MARADNAEPTRDLPEAPEVADRSNIVTANGARAIEPPGTIHDGLYLSPERMKALGIENAVLSSQVDAVLDLTMGDDGKGTNARDGSAQVQGEWVVCAIRDHLHSNRYEACESDRYWQVKERYPSAEIVKQAGGDRALGRQDLIYVKVRREEYERVKREQAVAGKDFYRNFKQGEVPGADPVPGSFDPAQGTGVLEDSKAQVSSLFQGMKTNWPAGMGLEDIEKFQGVETTQEIERRAAMGGRGERPGERERWKQWREERAKEVKSASKNRRYSFPGSPTR